MKSKSEEERQKRIEQEVLGLLRLHRFEEAVRTASSLPLMTLGVGGMMDWGDYLSKEGMNRIRDIFDKTPRILKGIDKDCLEKLRPLAAMMYIWGDKSVRSWETENMETGIHLDADVVARMLIFHAHNLNEIEEARSLAGFKTVEVLDARDENVCPACREISGKKYKIEKVPEVPYPECTSDMGCRCTIIFID